MTKKSLTKDKKMDIIVGDKKMQVSPSGMATASQAVPGEFDSRHLLQKENAPHEVRFPFGKIKCLLTRVEGGAASGNERFALWAWDFVYLSGKGGN